MPGVIIKNLNVSYGEEVVLDGFFADFKEHRINVILGGSGVGKTTLLNAVAGLVQYEGSIEKPSDNVSYIFQKDRLIPTISVYKNLDLILRTVCNDKTERKRRIREMLELLEIEDCARKLPTMLSGGQAQRAAMARAYLYPSEVLLLDEPFKALDTALKARLIRQLVQLNGKENRTVIFVTHAIDECLLLADEYFVLSGSPVRISYRGSIDVPQSERSLGDIGLAKVRDRLLKELY